jgi:hypothetical protein
LGCGSSRTAFAKNESVAKMCKQAPVPCLPWRCRTFGRFAIGCAVNQSFHRFVSCSVYRSSSSNVIPGSIIVNYYSFAYDRGGGSCLEEFLATEISGAPLFFPHCASSDGTLGHPNSSVKKELNVFNKEVYWVLSRRARFQASAGWASLAALSHRSCAAFSSSHRPFKTGPVGLVPLA